jgi:hypothetical protein
MFERLSMCAFIMIGAKDAKDHCLQHVPAAPRDRDAANISTCPRLGKTLGPKSAEAHSSSTCSCPDKGFLAAQGRLSLHGVDWIS